MSTATPARPRSDDASAAQTNKADGAKTPTRDDWWSYLRFGAMIVTSMVLMYGVMYLNTYELGHVRWSETRLFMTFLMGATMAIVMLSFMWSMQPKRNVNFGIYLAAALVFVSALWLVRSQATVDDSSYMRGMIPHHSIAVLTSENAHIEDLRVRRLADEIIAAQCQEIAEMNWLIRDIDEHGPAASQEEAASREAPTFSEHC